MGDYNPDWAIVKEEEGAGRMYLIRETKGSDDSEECEFIIRDGFRRVGGAFFQPP